MTTDTHTGDSPKPNGGLPKDLADELDKSIGDVARGTAASASGRSARSFKAPPAPLAAASEDRISASAASSDSDSTSAPLKEPASDIVRKKKDSRRVRSSFLWTGVLVLAVALGAAVLPSGSDEPAETPAIAETTQPDAAATTTDGNTGEDKAAGAGETETAAADPASPAPTQEPGSQPAPASADAVAAAPSNSELQKKLEEANLLLLQSAGLYARGRVDEAFSLADQRLYSLETGYATLQQGHSALKEQVGTMNSQLLDYFREATIDPEAAAKNAVERFKATAPDMQPTTPPNANTGASEVPVSAAPAPAPSNQTAQSGGSGQGTSGGGNPPPASTSPEGQGFDLGLMAGAIVEKCGSDRANWPVFTPGSTPAEIQAQIESCSEPRVTVDASGNRRWRAGEEPTYAPVASDPSAQMAGTYAPDEEANAPVQMAANATFETRCSESGGTPYSAEEWNAMGAAPELQPGEFHCAYS